ncbi:MAG TPA: beta-propeller domain-containing protein [Methanoregula sp.]|nr:beta-propeller domain-containing protein [Methanoregula sp.]
MSRTKLTLITLTTLVLILAVVIASGCMGTTVTAPAGDIKKFSSADEIREYIKNNTQLAQDSYYSTEGVWATDRMAAVPAMAVQESTAKGASLSGALPSTGGVGSVDYSQTNVQVAGVDEPDFVKNDARYIYVISGSTLTIVDAYPAASASVLSKTELEDTPREIFIGGDRLVLLKTGSAEISITEDQPVPDSAEKMAIMPPRYPYYRSAPVTHAVFYDISDRAHPKVLKDYTIDGDYVNARMIGDIVYLLSRESVYPYDDRIIVPAVRENAKIVATPDVYYFDNPERQYDFTTVTSFDARNGATKDAKTYLVGSGNIIYVSPDAMYVSYQTYHNIYRPMWGMVEPAIDVVQSSIGSAAGIARVSSPVLVEDFNTMSESERQAVIAEMKSGEQEAILKREIDQSTTMIHKIRINNGAITYIAKGEVAGYLKNQFAMDEYSGNLRVATTSDVWTNRGQYQYNNVFVLDGAMKTIGSLTHIAEQEKIYSTRFIGDRLYMVTFKRIDPFFVIDLSTPASPKILGKLKIPGYSDYLHPYDKNHIIGIGKETATTEWGGVSTKGLKLALFDVSDVEHPKQIDKVEIGDSGTDSAALTDHRAFLFDKNKNLLVIPARVVKQIDMPEKYSGDQQRIWYGAYVFGVAPETGFVLRGTVEHGTMGGYSWYGSPNEVKRSLYIGDTLYTLSQKKILANSLSQINTTIATIQLPGGGDVLYPDMKGI